MSDSDTSVETGWSRYFVKSSGALQRDLVVYRDESLTDLVFTVVGDKLQQFCTVLDNDVPIVRADLTTLAMKHRYTVDISDVVDVPLAVGLLWAITFAHLQRISGAGAAAAT